MEGTKEALGLGMNLNEEDKRKQIFKDNFKVSRLSKTFLRN